MIRSGAMRWAVVIIVALTLLRFSKGAGDPPYGVDASYYYQLARHVMNGEGFVTTVSLYHEGWVVPAKTPIYPLWPILLGYSGRVMGLERAADLLPRLFYVLDLVLLYFLARAIATRMGGLTLGRYLPDTAACIVAVFGLVSRFFGATTHPYTEGLAFATALAAFLALERFERTRGLGWAAASGLFAGLSFLARTQMVGVAIGCFLALGWFAMRDPRTRIALVAWSLVALLTIAPWLVFLGFIPGVTANTLPRVQLPRFEGWTEFPSTSAWLAQRATSVGVMFNPRDPYSYVQSFGPVAFLVPLAGLLALVRRRFHRPQSVFVMAVSIAGLFFFFNLMLYHSEVWMPWLFGWRHGLPYVFLILVAVPWLVANAGRWAPAIAIVLFVSIVMNAWQVIAFVRSPDPQLTKGEAELVQWLEAQPKKPAAITTNAQVLGSMTDARLYWTYCDAPGATTQAMWRSLPIDYVLLYEGEAKCRFATEAGPMRLVTMFGEPRRRVFVLRPGR
jgi:hypothetical protein